MDNDVALAATKSRLRQLLLYATAVSVLGGTATSTTIASASTVSDAAFYASPSTVGTGDVRGAQVESLKQEIGVAHRILQLISSEEFGHSPATELYMSQLGSIAQVGVLDIKWMEALVCKLRVARLRLSNDLTVASQWLMVAEAANPGALEHALPERLSQHGDHDATVDVFAAMDAAADEAQRRAEAAIDESAADWEYADV